MSFNWDCPNRTATPFLVDRRLHHVAHGFDAAQAMGGYPPRRGECASEVPTVPAVRLELQP